MAATRRPARPHAGIVRALGGPTFICGHLSGLGLPEITTQAVRKWARTEIPAKYRGHIVRLADQKGQREVIPPEFIAGVPTAAIAPLVQPAE